MTHEELLAKINKNAFMTARLFGWVVNKKESNALRAVVELHRPQDNYAGNVCGYCFDLAYEPTGLSMEYEDYVYPCPTIQVIEKELN